MATISAWVVGSLVEATRFQPRPAIWPFRTMTALTCFHFSKESRTASRRKSGFMAVASVVILFPVSVEERGLEPLRFTRVA